MNFEKFLHKVKISLSKYNRMYNLLFLLVFTTFVSDVYVFFVFAVVDRFLSTVEENGSVLEIKFCIRQK